MTDININLPDIPVESQQFLSRIFGPLADVGDLISDKIRFYRWKSALVTLKRANEIASQHGIDVQEIPLRTLVPLLEKASLEEEASPLIDKWANLLAQASSGIPDSYASYIDILSRLSHREVKSLEKLIDSKYIEKILDSSKNLNDLDIAISVRNSVNSIGQTQAWERRIKSITDSKSKKEYYEDIMKYFQNGIYRSMDGIHVGRCVFSFRPFEENDIFSLNHQDQSDCIDILVSCGLVNRNEWMLPNPDGLISVSYACPTSLGIKFVMACRGDNINLASAE